MRSAAEVTRPSGAASISSIMSIIGWRRPPEQKDEIYRLRYRAYLREGAILPVGRSERVTDRFDELAQFLDLRRLFRRRPCQFHSRQRGIARISGHRHRSRCFPTCCEPELAQGKVMVDPTRFVADPDRAKRFPELPYVTLRLAYVASGYFNADVGLATVRAEHQAFYRRFSCISRMCAPRLFPGLLKPICLMAVDYPACATRFLSAIPICVSSAFERRMLFTRSSERQHRRRQREREWCPACIRSSAGLTARGPNFSAAPPPRLAFTAPNRIEAARKARSGTAALPRSSPWRHICKSLTIAIAFRRLTAFDAVAQHLIKVDGTFA